MLIPIVFIIVTLQMENSNVQVGKVMGQSHTTNSKPTEEPESPGK